MTDLPSHSSINPGYEGLNKVAVEIPLRQLVHKIGRDTEGWSPI